jgi:4-alpha-glucanotransferase
MGGLKREYHDEITRDLEDEQAYEMWIQEQQQRVYEKDWQESNKTDDSLDLVKDLAVVVTTALVVYGIAVVGLKLF